MIRSILCPTDFVEGDTLRSDDERVREAEQRLQETVAELVVMGVQGSHALHTLFFGSTAQRVVRDARCAALAVRRT